MVVLCRCEVSGCVMLLLSIPCVFVTGLWCFCLVCVCTRVCGVCLVCCVSGVCACLLLSVRLFDLVCVFFSECLY